MRNTTAVFSVLGSSLIALLLAGCGGDNCQEPRLTGAWANDGVDSSNGDAASGSGGGSAGWGGEQAIDGGPDAAVRTVAEADVIQIHDDVLYALSVSGTVSLVDVSNPNALKVISQTALPGKPFEMYKRGSTLIILSNEAVDANGALLTGTITAADPYTAEGGSLGAMVTVLDVSSPENVANLASFWISGEIADSRIVGDVLYLATFESAYCYDCSGNPKTRVSSFDVSEPTLLTKVDELVFESDVAAMFNVTWAMAWKRSIVATSDRLYLGGLAPLADYPTGAGVVEVIDITDPTGTLVKEATIQVDGPVLSRWQMDEHDGVLRVISQTGAGNSANGYLNPQIETFLTAGPNFERIGSAYIKLPVQEGLKSVRFDGDRAYAITFETVTQKDPLFTIDLSDPKNPLVLGELEMPGWVFHIIPKGDWLIGLGIDLSDVQGSLNISLFDVSNMAAPTLTERLSFGPRGWDDYEITTKVLAEDQDRIHKAFQSFSDGTVAVPFSGLGVYGQSACEGGGVQLFSWANGSLEKQTFLPMSGHPRRLVELQDHYLGISDSNVRAFEREAIATRDELTPAVVASDVVIGECTESEVPGGVDGWEEGWEGDEGEWEEEVMYSDGQLSAERNEMKCKKPTQFRSPFFY